MFPQSAGHFSPVFVRPLTVFYPVCVYTHKLVVYRTSLENVGRYICAPHARCPFGMGVSVTTQSARGMLQK